jgi:hypothetical protein
VPDEVRLTPSSTNVATRLEEEGAAPRAIFHDLGLTDGGSIARILVKRGRIAELGVVWQLQQFESLLDGEPFPPELDIARWTRARWEIDLSETAWNAVVADLLLEHGIDLDAIFETFVPTS